MDAKELQLKRKLEFHLKEAAHLVSAIQRIDQRNGTKYGSRYSALGLNVKIWTGS